MSRGWRVPFVFGLLIGPFGFYLRRHLDDTLHQTVAAADACGTAAKKSAAAASSAEAAVPPAAAACVAATLLVIGGTSTMYTIAFSCLCSCS
ncbi:hypothetical protein [Burkholderia singularis]|uniref:Permeases of the major facilitator superfamily n=1 Tax=Burkholderia singularis TaxID=1503053 RepID=A0A238H6G2_9BURK|nr:hypothetical protein [Burkholderia singularis]SMG00814.1 Permeases of the major facilitator superfamily [Burkholderia singularis]